MVRPLVKGLMALGTRTRHGAGFRPFGYASFNAALRATFPAGSCGAERGDFEMTNYSILAICLGLTACVSTGPQSPQPPPLPKPDFVIHVDRTHDKFSRAIPPAITVPSGSVVEAYTHEASGGQLNIDSTLEDFQRVDMDRVHTLTGPIYVEGAMPGDVLAVELLDLEPGDWGWTGMGPEFGFLGDENPTRAFRTYALDKQANVAHFGDGITIPLRPFPGVMGVAPDTDEMLVTFPPRANGGNMDDPSMVAGTTVYFPVFVEGALFSLGDTHAAQGLGEVVGTAIESPMRIRFRVSVLKSRSIEEPQYETSEYYATTGFATTIDEAARKATRYMIQHLVETRGMTRADAYMLCSLAADLKIAEVVDMPHMLVTMHLPKSIFELPPAEPDLLH
jgi:acetamidase/formamidase